MGRYLLRRLIGGLVTVLAVSFVAYVALTYAPGDAAQALIGERASSDQLASLRRQLQLDAPLPERYGSYMLGVIRYGDFGKSLVSGRRVTDLLLERLPFTLGLAVLSMGLAALIGLGVGVVGARRPGSRLDYVALGGMALGLALPSYWVATLLVMLFSVRLHWLPVFGAGSVSHWVLPATTLALPAAAMVAKLVRSSVLEVNHAEFVRVARAKGLGSRQTMLRHVLPNSLIPAVTLLGLNLGHLIGGAFVVETVFAWPGLGRLMVQAIFDRDIPVVMGAVLVIAPLCLLVNLLVDLLHAALDPRVRHEAL